MSSKVEWQLPKSTSSATVKRLATEINQPTFICQDLVNLGITTAKHAERFLHPKLSDLDDPFKIHDMKKGVDRVKKAIKNKERIVIYGDYDADGITSASVMYLLLSHFHADVHYFLPDRFKDNYGPNKDEYKRIIKEGTTLLITTDNGISGLDEIAYARKHGMDVIITDHHDFPKKLPNANAIIMEKFPGHEYDHGRSDFCGVGMAFKFAQAMLGRIPTEVLDIVALGTLADSVNLRYENRVIVALGLQKIRHSTRKGIRALSGVSNTDLTNITANDLHFSLIPRLNAIGRMGNANPAVEMLTTNDSHKALAIAEMIEQYNNSRKSIMHQQTKEAMAQAEEPKNRHKLTLVLYDKHWFPGIVGIIAAQVSEKLGKPTIVIGHLKIDDATLIDRGSGRSIEGFDLFQALNPMQQGKHPVMASFGGHPFACGLSIKPYKIQDLADGLEHYAWKVHFDKYVPKVKPCFSITASEVSKQTLKQLSVLEPFGMGNEAPLIDLRLPFIYNVNQMGKGGQHLSFTLGASKHSTKVVAWQMGELAPKLYNDPFDVELAGTMQLNIFRGVHVQFVAQHIRHYTPRPSMDDIKAVYKVLYTQKVVQFGFAYQDLYKPLGQYLNIRPDKVQAIIQMFKDLKLMWINPQTMNLEIDQHPKQCKLSDSPTYQAMQK